MIPVWYMAHPVGAPDLAGVQENLRRAAEWFSFLRQVSPASVITAPWIGALLAGADDDSDPVARERGISDNCAVAARCDGIVLVGGRVSPGMQRELDAVLAECGRVSLLTAYGARPPASERPLLPDFLLRWGELEWQRRAPRRMGGL